MLDVLAIVSFFSLAPFGASRYYVLVLRLGVALALASALALARVLPLLLI
jgi:hypothetical protein